MAQRAGLEVWSVFVSPGEMKYMNRFVLKNSGNGPLECYGAHRKRSMLAKPPIIISSSI